MLPRKILSEASEGERAKWKIVRLDTYEELPGELIAADADAGWAQIRQRGPDQVKDGATVKTWETVTYTQGPNSIAIVRR